MKINRIGLNYSHNKNFTMHRPKGSGDYLFIYTKTPARFNLQGKDIIAEKNSVIIFKTNSPQVYSAHECPYTNDFIHFDADRELELHTLPLDTLILLPSTKQVGIILKEIYLEYMSNNPCRGESIDLLMKLLFVKIKEFAENKPMDEVLYSYYDILLNLRSMIYSNPKEKWTVELLSKQVNLSPSHFQRLYKQTFGVTCIADVINCKIEYAKASLCSSGSTIKEIASLCGYNNEEHFMRQFKKSIGITPSQYRKMIKSY